MFKQHLSLIQYKRDNFSGFVIHNYYFYVVVDNYVFAGALP